MIFTHIRTADAPRATRYILYVGPAGKGRFCVFVWFMVRLGLGRFGVGFWVGLRAWDFPTERALSRTPLNILEPRIKYLGSKIFRLRPAWGTAAAADSASRGVQIVLVSSVSV